MKKIRDWYNSLWGRHQNSLWREGVETVVVALGLALLIRAFIVQAFFIPSSSMEDTLLIDDHILVNKFVYRFGDPQRQDIVVFEFPGESVTGEHKDYIKRVIARPGETVLVRDGEVFVDGQPLAEPYAIHRGGLLVMGGRGDFGPLRVPRPGETVTLAQLNDDGRKMLQALYRRQNRELRWLGERAFLDSVPVTSVTVDGEYYFVMGDNRENSADSRVWGFLPRDHILGRAFCIYWPLNRLATVE